MDLGSYVDGITGLLLKAGVTPQELKDAKAEQTLSHCYLKGISFEDATASMCKKLGVQIAA